MAASVDFDSLTAGYINGEDSVWDGLEGYIVFVSGNERGRVKGRNMSRRTSVYCQLLGLCNLRTIRHQVMVDPPKVCNVHNLIYTTISS